MARVRTIICPQCNGTSPQKISETEYKCIYCDAVIHVEEKKPSPNIQDIFKSISGSKNVNHKIDPAELARAGRIVKLVVAIVVISIIAGIAVPLITTFSASTAETKDGMTPQSGWQVPSSDSKKYFVGTKGAVMWKMMKETGEKLDSARYTLLTIELKSGKRLSSQRWGATMTWRESFDFSKNYYDKIFAIGDTVWVISAENRLNAYNMYTGKLILSAEKLEDAYKEFAPGISEANQVYEKPVIEIKTDDGFEYTFIPGTKKIMLREKFSDYTYQNQTKKTFYALNQGTRQALWKIRDKVNLFEKQNGVSHWLGETMKLNKSNYMVTSQRLDVLDSVPSGIIFYKGKVLHNTETSAVVVYRESMAKKAAALVACVNGDGTIKWKTSLDQVKGLTDVFKNDQYLQYFVGENELVVIHESSILIGVGIDLSSGKINWTLYEDR